MSELDQFFETLEEEVEEEEEASGDVSSFPDPTAGIIDECYADFQKATGFSRPLSTFKPIVLKDYKGNVDEGRFGLETNLSDATDPLTSKATGCTLRIELNMGMNYEGHNDWVYRHRGESITAEVQFYLEYYLVNKFIPLAKYKRLPTKGVKRTWINSNIKKN